LVRRRPPCARRIKVESAIAAKPGGDVFKMFNDFLGSVRGRLEQERESAAQRKGGSPDASSSKRSALFGPSSWLDRGDERKGDYRADDSYREGDSSDTSQDSDTSSPD
jgi:hypothetical protein